MLTFYLVEICPRNAREVFTCIVIYLINAIVNANIFGQFLDLMTEINKTSDEMAEVYQTWNEAMFYLQLKKS